MVEFDRSAFVAKFQEEAADLLQRLNEGVIMLESDPGDSALIEQMLRDAHTLKGSSRMVGLIEISDVAHRLEDIMVGVRDGTLEYAPEFSDAMFEALDAIVFLSDNGGENKDGALDLDALAARLASIAALSPAEDASSAADEASRDALGEDEAAVTPSATAQSAVRVGRDDELKVKEQTTIRVRTAHVDNLLNLVSEVVIAQIKAEQRSSQMRTVDSETADVWRAWQRIKAEIAAMASVPESLEADVSSLDATLAEHRRVLKEFAKGYADDVSRASSVVNDVQDQGMQLRMLPVNTIFQTFPRAVRDLAKEFHKDIDLVIEGGDTELDKKVLEEINDPLVHIVRNAVDHGIESPDVRRALGKPEAGTVTMSARSEGDRIVVEVRDDGAGIDPDKVREAAVRKGYLSQAEAATLTDREAQYLIFEQGFSTAAIITEISGRGIGMDVVRTYVVEKLKGSLDIFSQPGKGTTFRLTIPLTLAIIRALMLRVGDRVFALPTASVDETLRLAPDEILQAEGRQVVRRGRRTIALVRLADLLGIASDQVSATAKTPVVTLSYSGQRMGFVADAFVGEQQIVIKPLGTHLERVDNIAGVTVVGAGDVVPILNVPDLMANARLRSGHRAAPVLPDVERPEHEVVRRVLICEDSFTTRELERSIFEAAGYEVETAADGAQGLARLREGLQVDAVVTDVQMPTMNGFDLTRSIKGDDALARIPVVIVTSLEREEEKAEGVSAGADAYITKSVLNQDTLLDTVESLIR